MTATITDQDQQQPSNLHIYNTLGQGTDEWFQARCGLVTASVMHNLVTSRQPTAIETTCPECNADPSNPCTGKRNPGPLKTLHPARAAAARELDRVITADTSTETAISLALTLAAQRITNYVEPAQTSRAMERGQLDEPYARDSYSEHHGPVTQLDFMIRDFDSFKIGYSPDGLVGENGLIEIKSRDQKIQLKTVLAGQVPAENIAQLQTGLLVSGRPWIDYTSYSGGMKLWVKRVYPDLNWHAAILLAVAQIEKTIAEMIDRYQQRTADLPTTERIDHYAEIEIGF